MLRYFGTRLLVFIPTLLVISMVAFALSRLTPGDPVECGFDGMSEMNLGTATDRNAFRETYANEAKVKGLDKPYFYFSFTSAAYPDTLYRILDRFERQSLNKLIAQYGNWPRISEYYSNIQSLEEALFKMPKNQSRDGQIVLLRDLNQLKIAYQKESITALLDQLQKVIQADSLLGVHLANPISSLASSYQSVQSETTPGLLKIPRFYWHGLGNQYHHWFSRFIKGDFGTSCRNSQPVLDRIKPSLFWTLMMSLPAFFLAFSISIPIGVYTAVNPNSWFDKISTVTLFILFSLPSFWIATILIVFFTTKEYAWFMDIFPGVGLGDLSTSAPFWDRFWESSSHLILPVFCMTYSAFAFISRQMRRGVIDVIRQDYIRTAKAKGLPKNKIIWKHVFRNSLFPLITMIAMVLPSLIGGAVIIEVLFNIPGMGRETVDAIRSRDWPVVYTVLMLAAVLTLIGNLLGDFLYAMADPRVTLNSRD